jgi:hypothetical protein
MMDRVPDLNWPMRLFRDVEDRLLIDDADFESFAEEADLRASAEALSTGKGQTFAVRYRYPESA